MIFRRTLKWTGPSFAGTNGVLIAQQWLYDGTGISNRAAIAYPQSASMVQNTNLAILLQGAGTNLTYSINTSPAHGTLTGTPPNVTYTSATNYTGSDSFTFYVNNGVSNSAPATVSISIIAGLPVAYYWKNAVSGNWSVAGNWTNAAGAAGAPAATGQAFYTLNFNPSGTYSVTNDLNDGFLLNQLNVAGAVTFADTSALTFTTNGTILPQLNQNSASAVTFNTPVILAAMTSLGGTGGGQVTVNSVISGAGGLTMNNPGMLQINNVANNYSGSTVINSGTVALGLQVDQAFGTGPVTLNGGTLTCNRDGLVNSFTLGGGTIVSGNSFQSSLQGPVTVTGYPTFNIPGGFVISGNMSGPGGLINSGGNGLSITGTNNCTGATYVTAGTLSFGKSVSVSSGLLSISDGAIASLNYSGTRVIPALMLGGTNEPYGTYGSISSSATFKDTHFTGNGTVTVVPLATLTSSPATSITSTSATLNVTLGCPGTNATVYSHWNTVNGGTSAALWTNAATIGAWTNVTATNLSYAATGLSANTTYYFTFRGTNAGGNVWAANVQSFTTLAPPTPTRRSRASPARSRDSSHSSAPRPALATLLRSARRIWPRPSLGCRFKRTPSRLEPLASPSRRGRLRRPSTAWSGNRP